MGQSVWELRRWMTEWEFQAHRAQMRVDPDPEVQSAYLLKMVVPGVMATANGLGAKFKINAEMIDPWAAARESRQNATSRVQLMAELVFGFPPGA